MRIEYLEGRPHAVTPVVMLREAVLSGSNGPLLYPAEEIEQSAASWSGVPILVKHAEMWSELVSAAHPTVHDRQRIGTVFNSRYWNRKLVGEAWIDIERTRQLDSRIIDAIQAGKPLEVSTGLFSQDEDRSGTFNGRAYNRIARYFRPDHLAILPDERGACSMKDGCGLGVTANRSRLKAIRRLKQMGKALRRKQAARRQWKKTTLMANAIIGLTDEPIQTMPEIFL